MSVYLTCTDSACRSRTIREDRQVAYRLIRVKGQLVSLKDQHVEERCFAMMYVPAHHDVADHGGVIRHVNHKAVISYAPS